MANKAISELPQALNVNNQDLFVIEQGGLAKKLPAETLITEQGIIDALATALDGHGGIQSVTLSSVSGRIRTYRITFTDQSATTFQVYDGTSIDRISRTSSSGLDDVYTIFLSDGTTTFFTVHNGADGNVSEAMLNDALKDKAPVITETTESSAVAVFNDGADDMVMHNVVAEINPVQDLSNGDPSPSNICPISGRTSVSVTRVGKNLLSAQPTLQTNQAQLIADLGENTTGQTFTITFDFDNVNYQTASSALIDFEEEGGTHHYLTPSNFSNGQNTLANATKPASGRYSYTGSYTFRYVYSYFMSGSYGKWSGAINNAQLEFGSTATVFEAYATALTVDWSSEAGTVYGGTIDVATGLLTVTHQIFLVPSSGITWTINNNAGYKSLSALGFTPSNMIKNPPAGTTNRTWTRTNWCKTNALIPSANGWSATASSNDPQFVVTYDDYLMLNIGVAHPTSAQINQFITDVGLQLYYPLATPQTYQFTGQQLKTLYGTNNVWATTGNVSVTYPADTKMFIEKLTMPTEDDLVANQAITNGKFFMVGNNLYLATAAIASGAKIIEGTNATRLSLADALNRLQ